MATVKMERVKQKAITNILADIKAIEISKELGNMKDMFLVNKLCDVKLTFAREILILTSDEIKELNEKRTTALRDY